MRPDKDDRRVQATYRTAMACHVEELRDQDPPPALERKSKAGVVICAGGLYLASAYVTVRALRHVGCELEVEVWHLPGEVTGDDTLPFHSLGVRFHEAVGDRTGWQLKPYALRHSRFRHALLLDADCYPAGDNLLVAYAREYGTTGAVFFPDSEDQDLAPVTRELLGVTEGDAPWSQESGVMLVDTVRHWLPLELAQWMNDRSEYYYQHFWGDKDTYHLAWRRVGAPYTMAPRRWCLSGPACLHYDESGRPLVVHRVLDKFKVVGSPQFCPSLPLERECRGWLAEYKRLVGCR